MPATRRLLSLWFRRFSCPCLEREAALDVGRHAVVRSIERMPQQRQRRRSLHPHRNGVPAQGRCRAKGAGDSMCLCDPDGNRVDRKEAMHGLMPVTPRGSEFLICVDLHQCIIANCRVYCMHANSGIWGGRNQGSCLRLSRQIRLERHDASLEPCPTTSRPGALHHLPALASPPAP